MGLCERTLRSKMGEFREEGERVGKVVHSPALPIKNVT